MKDFVKQLFENNVISEDMKSEIESAWQSKIQENRDQVTNELREEFAQKFEHEKSLIVESVESMISDVLAKELAELIEDRQGLIETRANYARKMKNDTKAFESFIMHNLAKEISDLNEDRKAVANNVAKLETFIIEALSKEIADFYKDKRDLANTKVKLVRESKQKFNKIKKDFISKSADIIEETVVNSLTHEMTQLREDIDAARRNDFGRRIFESFASEYAASHLNEKSETAKLLKIVNQKELELKEAANLMVKSQLVTESKDKELKSLKESIQRKDIMNELLTPLMGEKRNVMKQLLESTRTDKLYTAYDKYLPSVLNENNVNTNRKLTESYEITGNKKEKSISRSDNSTDMNDIRRLAGLRV
jgi:hypothetical protein